jgi:hypothetical protein
MTRRTTAYRLLWMTLALAASAGCFKKPKVGDGSGLMCFSDDNCLPGWVCTKQPDSVTMEAGLCVKADGGVADAPVFPGVDVGGGEAAMPIDGAASIDGTAPAIDGVAGTDGSPDQPMASDLAADTTRDTVLAAPDGPTDFPMVTPDIVPSADAPAPDVPIGGAGGAIGSGGVGGAPGIDGGFGTGGISGAGGTTTTVVDCGPLAAPENGSVSAPTTTVGSTATYSCTTGYGPSGSSTRYCLADGNWTGVAPTCVIANCPALPGPNNGTVSAPTLTFGSTATYACLPGYALSGAATRVCQPDGTWDGTAPTCVPVDCGALPSPTNGSVNTPTTTYNSAATYACTAGYTLSSTTPRVCQADKTWSGTAPTCAPVDCGPLTAPENGFVSAPTTTYNSVATYSCTTGYGPSGSSTRTCQADGTWNGSAPTCVIANCPALPGPTDGSVFAPVLTYGATATYSCDAGYTMTGSNTRICQPNGTWDGSAPTCTIVDCLALTAPTNGSVNVTTTTYNSTATYSCSTGYNISSTTPRTCQANGEWSGTAPTCTLVDCLALTAPDHGSVSAPITTYNSTATYSCTTGYLLTGDSTRTCQVSGLWSGTAPTCVVDCGGVTCTGGETRCSATGSLETCTIAGNGCPAWTSSICSSGLVCERCPPADCLNPNWAEWPMPNTQADVAAGAPNPASYTDNGDGTITDNVTQLMWQKTSSIKGDFTAAWGGCSSLTLAGYDDWRLPSLVELLSIDELGSNPAFNSTYFGGLPDFFWTSTRQSGSYYWVIGTMTSQPGPGASTQSRSARCVR